MNNEAIELIIEVLHSTIEHPMFCGFENEGIDWEEVNDEGGDTAFVTLDVAWKLKKALDLLGVAI